MADRTLVLASGSPRRLDLLRLAGLEPVVRVPHVDETPAAGEDAEAYVERLAGEKACAVDGQGCVVLAADTAVVLDGAVLGKPADAAAAVTMLRGLSGRTHTVCTGVAVVDAGGRVASLVVTTHVEMAALGEATIEQYVATGEPLDKAGAYAIQGRAAAFVRRIDGSWTNVVGLPLVESLHLLRDAGLPGRPGT